MNRSIDCLFEQKHEETVTGMKGKERKERNLVSSQNRVARDSHHHGSSGVLLVCSSCVHQWWVSPCHLVARPFIRCLGRLFPGQRHIPHIPPVLCMCFFLSLDSDRLWRGLVSGHIFHNDVPILPLRLVLGGCLFLVWFVSGWTARRSS